MNHDSSMIVVVLVTLLLPIVVLDDTMECIFASCITTASLTMSCVRALSVAQQKLRNVQINSELLTVCCQQKYIVCKLGN